jgi:transposase, IS5 family
VAGDIHNALLAGIGYNLKLRFNQIKEQIVIWLNKLFNFPTGYNILVFVEIKNIPF